MRFRTEIPRLRAPFTLSPERPVVMLGSCFSDNITEKMRSCLWPAENPFGTLFNPISIAAALRLSLMPEKTGADEFRSSLFGHSPIHSRFFGTKLSAIDADGAEMRFLHASGSIRKMLDEAQALFVTFGTAWVYALADHPEIIVGNCHKQPASLFIRRRLTIKEIVNEWVSLAEALRERWPNLHIIFTVSPVRHLKDGFEGNSRSKAVLQLAVEQLTEAIPDSYYFPAYELLNDDLRDYRFYAADLAHPSQQAIEYIWERFCETFLDKEGAMILKEGNLISRGYAHRPMMHDPQSESKRRDTLNAASNDFGMRHPSMLKGNHAEPAV